MTAPVTVEPDVIDLLLAQHAQIERLFGEVLLATGDQQHDRFHELVRLLAVHETAEEEVVHPMARRSIDGGAEVIDARLDEERQAKELLAALDHDGPDAPDFRERLLALRQAVLSHARYEERYEFPQLRLRLQDASLAGMAKAVKAAEAVAPTRPHPGVESATKNVLAGPLAAIVDRTRDALRSAGTTT
ncbi:hemerythrin domain-containing protein [Cryptosporangium aurantiacum]|uniref:Hemerythrin HHE cation binding domain-containing protein n=1 Tax=Cryptosporangium aurantiacum TaxID=134849 RepID=A0A1M7RLY6_9ACTN|nr:hemerythrin domain-containing protein [Cryptosporangium aurantiacum]SHN47190.1 Hemerythrin HHE cation binding domain-containing protein [Cryptosporangium aurantiacum]